MINFIKLLFAFSLFFSSIHAASYTCPGENLLNIDNASTDQNDTYDEDSTGSGTYRVFTFTPSNGGEMTVSFLAPEKQTIEIGTTCGGVEIDKDTSGSLSYTHTFYAKAGTQYYVKIEEKNGSNELKFTANFQFKAIKIGFEQAVYNISEDLNIPDNATQALELTVTLTHATTFPIDVTYNTMEASPPSATLGVDFKALTGFVTFAAGETQKTVYVDIIHDVPIELEENFDVELSNISTDTAYTDVVGFGDYNPTNVIILEQTLAQTCFEDDFSTSLDEDWRLLYSSGGYEPAIVNGRLRMTTATGNLATAVTKDWEFAAAENLITIEFDHFAYNGSGADGFAMVLYDSSIGASPNVGAFGGSLGYAQKDAAISDATVDQPGFEGGWLGLGLDEYGNFSRESEGRIGGLSTRVTHSIALRGKGSGQTGYMYLDGTASDGSLSPVLWSSATNYSGGRFKMTIDSRDTAHIYITLERDSNRDGGYEDVIINKSDAIGTQGASPDYIRLAVTASTGGSNAVHELDNLLVTGVCREYGLTLPDYSAGFVDAIDPTYSDATYTDANGPDITTKVTNKGSYNFDVVYLGSDGTGVETYSPSGTFNTLPLTVRITVADETCSNEKPLIAEDGSPFGWAEILVGNSSGTTISPVTMTSTAMPDARLRLKALDWNSLFSSVGAGSNCGNASSLHGNLCGVPACLGNANQANDAFPSNDPNATIAQRNADILTECYGLPADGSGNTISSTSPCRPANYTGNCGGVNGTILPSEYSNKVGCLACILDKSAESTCSVDRFAIRPEKFNLSSTHSNMPSLVRAGQDYNLTVTATDYASSTPTQDYNQTSDNLDTSGLTKWENSPRVINNTLNGAASLGDFNITNGTSTYNGTPGEVAEFSYSDVGFITLSVQDTNWSSIDSEDTPGDCTADGRYICGDKNLTVIPHHFSLDVNLSNNNGFPGTFTYIANLDDTNQSTFNMAARVRATIVAQNESNGTTLNFQSGTAFYENPVTLDLNASNLAHSNANATSILNALLGFGTGTDTNGTKTIVTHDDTNLSVVLRFNFPRDVNDSLNPFQVFASDVNLSISSIYTQATGTANIRGQNIGLGDGNATMIYGRTNGPLQSFTAPIGTAASPAPALIYYESYCNATDTVGVTCNKALLPNGIDSNSTNDPRWFVNKNHTAPTEGELGSVNQKTTGTTHVTPGTLDNTVLGQTTVPLTYDTNQDYPYKATMENNASSWLIYNKYDATAQKNEFEVEFIGPQTNNWAGQHETNTTTDTNASQRTNRRSMW